MCTFQKEKLKKKLEKRHQENPNEQTLPLTLVRHEWQKVKTKVKSFAPMIFAPLLYYGFLIYYLERLRTAGAQSVRQTND